MKAFILMTWFARNVRSKTASIVFPHLNALLAWMASILNQILVNANMDQPGQEIGARLALHIAKNVKDKIVLNAIMDSSWGALYVNLVGKTVKIALEVSVLVVKIISY